MAEKGGWFGIAVQQQIDIKRINVTVALRILKQSQSKGGKIVETTFIPNTTEEPLKATPNQTYAQVFSKCTYLFPARKTIMSFQRNAKKKDE